MRRVGFAAITLERTGGGVAVASRLIWQVLRDGWGDECRLVTLVDAAQSGTAGASTTARVRFGMHLAATQALGDCQWIFYSHLAVAQVQQYVPPLFRKPYAVFLHGIEAWRVLTPAQRRTLKGARLLIANSAFTASRVVEAHPWIGPIVTCPLALPRDEPSDESPGSDSPVDDMGPRAVILVGRMDSAERYKGHDQLLEAWPAVIARLPEARLVFVGSGDDAPRLERKAQALGLRGRVIFTGFLSDQSLASTYQRSAVFAMPSREEGFGLAYLEAMANRLPCIGSRHDAAGDVIVDGMTGFLVDQSSIPMLADRIVTLLTDEARRQEMGNRGYDRFRQHFLYDRFRDRLLALLAVRFGAPEAAALVDASHS